MTESRCKCARRTVKCTTLLAPVVIRDGKRLRLPESVCTVTARASLDIWVEHRLVQTYGAPDLLTHFVFPKGRDQQPIGRKSIQKRIAMFGERFAQEQSQGIDRLLCHFPLFDKDIFAQFHFTVLLPKANIDALWIGMPGADINEDEDILWSIISTNPLDRSVRDNCAQITKWSLRIRRPRRPNFDPVAAAEQYLQYLDRCLQNRITSSDIGFFDEMSFSEKTWDNNMKLVDVSKAMQRLKAAHKRMSSGGETETVQQILNELALFSLHSNLHNSLTE